MKSTKEIVQGNDASLEEEGWENVVPTEPSVPRKKKTPVVVGCIVTALILALAVVLVVLLINRSMAKAPAAVPVEPTEANSVSLDADQCLLPIGVGSMADAIAPGDVVSVGTAQGILPELQYVEVAEAKSGTVTVKLDTKQLSSYLSASGKRMTLAIRAFATDERKKELLAYQQSYNNPSVKLAFADAEMTLGKGQTKTAEIALDVTPREATPTTLTWTSNDEGIVKVSQSGELEGVAVGTAEVTVEALGSTATLPVTVKVLAEQVQLGKTELRLVVGQTAPLTAAVVPEDAEDKSIVWTSSDEKIATVRADGTVTAITNGSVTISASCGEAKAECTVTVYTTATGLTVSKAALGLKVGASERIMATPTPEAAAGQPVTWKSSNDKIATVSADGTITAIAKGTATISASCDGVTAQCVVTVS